MVEVDRLFVNPPKKHCLSFSDSFGSNVAFVVMFKLRMLLPATDHFKDFG
jgi:hypothetical protein